MKLSIESVTEVGGFAGEPVPKTIEWKQIDDEGVEQEFKADTFVRRGSCASFEREARAVSDGKDMVATRIAWSICDESGQPVFNYEQALSLRDTLTAALFKAVTEVNPARAKKS